MNRRGVNLPKVVFGRNGHGTRLSIYNSAEVTVYWVGAGYVQLLFAKFLNG